MNDTLEGMWKEAAVAYFKVLAWTLPGGTEEIHEIPQLCKQSLCQISLRHCKRDINLTVKSGMIL